MIEAIALWAQSQRWHASALHLLEMLPIFGVGVMVTGDPWTGAVAVWAFYYARKMTETRAATERTLGVTLSASNLGLFPWDWYEVSPWLVVDFMVPAIGSAGFAFALQAFFG